MSHLSPPEACRLPVLAADERPAHRDEAAIWPGYRSEAFAEDLLDDGAGVTPRRLSRPLLALLVALPTVGLIVGSALVVLAHRA